MSFGSWLKRKVIIREVKKNRKEAMAGKLGGLVKWMWDVLDGHKGQIISIIATMKLLWPENPIVRTLDSIAESLWAGVQGSFDPANAAILGGLVISLGHHVLKSYREKQAGLPMTMVGKSVLDMPRVVVDVVTEKQAPVVVEAIAEEQAPKVVAAIKAEAAVEASAKKDG